ncbi:MULTISPECIES: tRNA (adenosine(37)-N6)-dimethylallyltransferase MiaA [Salinicola]|uniref:tRNA dimethylallyltransferase n=1 Tax=Salinicola socius TaxID=404433 RepID=A0A1Q8SSR3_9GAMM|nr:MULTISPECIES: tRNA (adenosine(37)-N6)-dimethylallyltransferase MiaA [Salinicola]OLO04464.1 tRNA (adenosine(37)-N6)-dimethylallyltransferase MiaA [Salinicola socius]
MSPSGSRRDDRPLAVLLLGPTASGKTDNAIALHQRFGAELISVDSAMVYRGMDIGTAKPSPDELARAPHRLIDIRDPAEAYTAAEFRRDALREMEAITACGKLPLLVGGTMMYAKRLIDGVATMPEADPALREKLRQRGEREGFEALHAELAGFDPQAAEAIHPRNRQRLIRALEVYRLSGVALSEHWRRQQRENFPWRLLSIALAPAERHVLHARIAQRFDIMLAGGFVSEVATLKQRSDLHPDLPSMKSVGYRQVWEHLEGAYDHVALRERGIAATRQLAKRQLTWLRRWPDLHWVDSCAANAGDQIAKIVRDHGS